DAVDQGKISRERIEASVERIFKAKQKVCPQWNIQAKHNPASTGITIHDFRPRICTEQAITLTNQILNKSLQSGNLPLTPQLTKTGKGRNLIIVDDLINTPFLDNQTEAIATPAKHGYQLELIDTHTPDYTGNTNEQPDGTILQVFIRGNAFRNSAILVAIAQKCYRQLIANQQLQALVIYGSPYTLELFLPKLPENTPYIFTYGQMPAAQAIAMKHLFANK
ncbi:MAG: beta-glucosidase, partial [Microcoleaceae cyanobacterium]